jgi:hypothetical protein
MSGKFKVPIQLVDEMKNSVVTVLAGDGHLAILTEGEEHTILDDRTVLGSMASQDADSVAITGGSIVGITPLAVADGGTGATTATAALTNLGAVPTSRTVNGKSLNANITLGPSDVGALATTTSYGASLAADGEDISLIDQNGDTLSTVQTQDITGKLDKQAVYSSLGVTSTFFHEQDGGGYRLADTNDGSLSFIGGNADTESPIKVETYAKTVEDNVGTRIIQTLEKVFYTAGKSSATFVDSDEVAVKSDIPTSLSQLTNDGNYVVDPSYVHTDSNFTSAEKEKLAGLDDNHFKGSYPSLTALKTAYPTASDGDYAYVGTEGTPATMYIWDVTDSQWVLGGSPAGETPASVKEKYESNADTNAFTDDDVALIGTIGDVEDLITIDKDTLVDAVNEVVGTFSDYVPTTRTVNNKSLSSNITLANSDIGSEPAVTAVTTAQFWRGDKSWQDFGDSVRAIFLTGLSTATKTSITATDTIIIAFGKLQAQITAGFQNPMTTAGDIIVGGTNGTPTRLAVGNSNTFLKVEYTPSGDPQLGYTSATNSASNINAVTYGNSRYYYVGDSVHGYFYGSGSITFNNISNSYALRGVCMGLPSGAIDTIVACGDGGKIVTSSSSSFSILSDISSGTTNDLISMARRNDIFVAVGKGGTIVTSQNISSGFSPVSSGTTTDLHRVRVVNGMFVAVGDSCVLFSTDGVSWSAMDNIYGNPNITDVVYDDTTGRYLFTSYNGTAGQVFITDDIAHYYISIPLTVANVQLLTIAMVNGDIIVAGAQGYAAISKSQGNDFTVLPTGVTKDINDMLWTDTFVGAIVCSDAVVGLNKFSGGASNVLKYKPVPLASTSSPGIVQPDMLSITIDSNGIISASGGGGGGADDWVPSSQYIDITYGLSGDTYTAPADGWIYVKCTTSNTNAYIIGEAIVNEETSVGVYGNGQTTYSSGRALYLLFPVGAGYRFKMWNSNLTVNIFRFIYEKGAL